MPRGVLRAYQDELVTVLGETKVGPDALGQYKTVWTPNGTHSANVQPLGAEMQQQMGLTADRERLRVQLPPQVAVTLATRLRFRGRDWKAVRYEGWQSYRVLIVEGV